MSTRIVLAFSGGLASSAAIPWLAARYSAEVIAVALDLGQSRDLEGLRARALALGARRAHVIDARDEFARDCILPCVQGGAPRVARGVLAAPLLARKLAEIALIEGASLVAHGGDRDDHAAIEAAARSLDPHLRVVAPALEWDMAPDALAAYATGHGIVVSSASGPGRRRVLDTPAHLEVAFERGVPVAVNGVPMALAELLESVSTIADNHGVGGVSAVHEPTMYEAPAASVLSQAHGALMSGGPDAATGTVRMTLFQGELTIP